MKIVPAKGVNPSAALDLPKVCIVTGEFVGLFRNGGLGTSMTGTAELLAACGADVTVLYTGDIGADSEECAKKYERAGIKIQFLKKLKNQEFVGRLESVYQLSNSWRVYDYLRSESFDVIHFNDTLGEGVCSVVAKKIGLAFDNTLINLAIHSPTEWINYANRHPANWLGFACFVGSERICIEFADVVWGPSQYLLNWLAENKYDLADQVINQQYVVPTPDLFEPGTEKLIATAAEVERNSIVPKEIVFFGRLEERKGLRLFVAALSQISDFLKQHNISVVFMGKPSSVSGKDADVWIAENSKNWDFNWRIESGFGQKEAIAFLRASDRLAVMASPIDNSPCTVYEAMQHGIPFLASTGGGIPELIHQDDRATHLFDYNIAAMSNQIRQAVTNGIAAARPSISIAENQARWLTFHRDWKKYLPVKSKKKSKVPKWAVLVEHESGPTELLACLESLGSELGVDSKDIVVVRRENSNGTIAANVCAAVIDDATDETIAQSISNWISQGYDGLVCVRSAMKLVPCAGAAIAGTLNKNIAAYSGQLAIGDGEQVFVGYASSPSYLTFEGRTDSGVMVVDLGFKHFAEVLEQMDDDRYFGGLLEQIHREGGVVAPFPTALAQTELLENAVLQVRGEQRRLLALSQADGYSSYMCAGVGSRMYDYVMGNSLSVVKEKVAAIAGKNPLLYKTARLGYRLLRRVRGSV